MGNPENVGAALMPRRIDDEPGDKLLDVIEQLGTVDGVFGVPLAQLVGATDKVDAQRFVKRGERIRVVANQFRKHIRFDT